MGMSDFCRRKRSGVQARTGGAPMSLMVREQAFAAVPQEVVVDRLRPLLSPRELEVAQLALSGLPTAEVARRLFVTVNTVKTHIRHILRKTGTESRAELVRRLLMEEELAAGKRDPVTGFLPCTAFRRRALDLMRKHRGQGVSLIWLEAQGRQRLSVVERVAADLAVAEALSEAVRAPDLAFRWSEDQFLGLLPATDREVARTVTMRLGLWLGEWASVSGCDLLFSLACSSSLEGLTSPEALMEAAVRRSGEVLEDIA
ncbi:MAG: hypothetical protein CWE10_11290 [Symbiobacterium thermophilum]|uniref:HTH luxR-type domain-containing protein n=2 Tax=Symbiobacterium thermophilum TaxID=2734 RepID=A0A953ICE8_SYMTR|nr:hypothetical protein [Symbiobacterium thermophilum]